MKNTFSSGRLSAPAGFVMMILLLILCATPLQAQEEGHYISSQLQLGLHSKASLSSPIKTLVSSGMPVEILDTKGDFSQVKLQDGSTGWLKTQFVTDEQSAEIKLNRLQQSLSDSDTELSSDEDSSSCEAINETLREELEAWQQLDLQDRQSLHLMSAKQTQALKKRLTMIAALAAGEPLNMTQAEFNQLISESTLSEPGPYTLMGLFKKYYLVLLMVAGVSFLLGLFTMDSFNRRRHGGYRV